MNSIFEPWPWYTSGAIIAMVMFLLLLMEKNFGMSSNLRTLCTLCGANKKLDFFNFDWKTQRWNLIVLIGAIIGGYFASNYMLNDQAVNLNPLTVKRLQSLGFESAGTSYLPIELYGESFTTNIKSIILLAIGGLLVGFGTRYAGGCTSGHAISGLSDLQVPSLLAVIGFFVGGLLMIHLLFPLIF